jgi:hypothetical protein
MLLLLMTWIRQKTVTITITITITIQTTITRIHNRCLD